MVLNKQWECGFSKGSPSLINTFVYLRDGPLAGMPVTVTDWKRCLYIYIFKRQNWKIAFYQHFRTLNLFGNQQLYRMPPRAYVFFQAETHISLTLQVTIKKVVYHIIFIVLAIFQGIWRFWVYECTCLRISRYFLCTLQVWVLLLAFPIQ